MLSTALCPDPATWRIGWVASGSDRIMLHLEPIRRAVPCPSCGVLSSRVHSRYRRRAWDLPWCSWQVQLMVYTRRFFCGTPECQRRIFAEPFPNVLPPYARQTLRLRGALLELSHASGAEMASRLAKLLGFSASPDTLIRRQRQEALPTPSPKAIGVDEFALRRGSTYATILVDLEQHRPVAVVEDRKAAPVATYLAAHSGIEVLARDRAGAYALAGRTAAPNALQVADRFHLVHNVSDALRELCRSRRWVVPAPEVHAVCDPPIPQSGLSPTARPHSREPQPTPTKQARWEAVQQRKDKGQSLVTIARDLGMNRHTVRQYLAADKPPVYPPRRPRRTRLTPYLSYLTKRWAEGCHNARRLYSELTQQGYTGSERQVRAAVRTWRGMKNPPPAGRAMPLQWLVLPPPSHLDPSDREELDRVLAVNPPLALGYRLKERFRELVAHRDIAALDRWIEEAGASALPTFRSLAKTFHQDYQAIKAALTTPWSTGQVEGQNTRVKLIKRIGYGRAKLDLLRVRILHRAAALMVMHPLRMPAPD